MEGMRPMPPAPPEPAAAHLRDLARNPALGGRAYAGFGYRVAAYLFDAGVALAAGVAAAFAAGGAENWQSGGGDTVFFLTAIAVWFVVTSVAMGVFRGQTLGKRLAGTRVVHGGGTPAGFGTSLLRDQLARILFVVPLFFLVDSIWAAASEERQALRDKMVSTYVVRETGTTPRAWGVALAAAACLAIWVAGTSALDAGSSDEPGEGFSDLDQRVFVDSCTEEGSSRSECVCLFEHISARVSYDDYADAGLSENPDDWPRPVQDASAAANDICIN